jgi:hypothetical protein
MVAVLGIIGLVLACLVLALLVVSYIMHRQVERAADDLQAVLSWEPETMRELSAKAFPHRTHPPACIWAALEVLVEEGWARRHEPARQAERFKWSRARGGTRRRRRRSTPLPALRPQLEGAP